ncbi:hypothetical protein BCV72DRAFT_225678 [Rhizopus microsporus var. microsporus]|uniref:Uncharacterized protein n=2 Tax=Rhizopus microsporus TaxID=58291 RepID=A0A2G4SUY3_RHIZD|nr:uncharacterized protein RHIMIDRAFT_282555 [Rhizopus microsporus ATCC 52813]ORE08052.1 hypothetical protein BCV72DRAFT_225678 [Rhizopus microsporus var. microsporus]PHZ12570.1 hypothetical protein RHIMIDRAFT_282555 [Rhizopus microsporus ATCC 52813]
MDPIVAMEYFLTIVLCFWLHWNINWILQSMEWFLEKVKRRIEIVADEDENTRESTIK